MGKRLDKLKHAPFELIGKEVSIESNYEVPLRLRKKLTVKSIQVVKNEKDELVPYIEFIEDAKWLIPLERIRLYEK